MESDVRLLIEAIEHAVAESAAKPEAPMRPGLMELQKRRAREIASQLENARQAFESGDFEGTLWACDKALLLDPQTPEALDLLDRARKALDEKKISAWLEDARKALARGDIGTASDLIDQALAVDRDSQQALTIRDEMLELRRERERERDRALTVQAATDRARASVEEGDFESAGRHADDALAVDSAADWTRRISNRRRLRRSTSGGSSGTLKRRAQQTVADARSRFEAGAHQDALASLREFSPGHELVSEALQELQDQLEAIQRKVAEENERLEELRRAEEAQRAAAEQALAEKKAREEAEKKAREDKERRDRERREEEARILAEARGRKSSGASRRKRRRGLPKSSARRGAQKGGGTPKNRNTKKKRRSKQRAANRSASKKKMKRSRLAAEAQRQKEAREAERRKEEEERWRKEAERRAPRAEEARRHKEAQAAQRRKDAEDAGGGGRGRGDTNRY